jgi:hypothetical protein
VPGRCIVITPYISLFDVFFLPEKYAIVFWLAPQDVGMLRRAQRSRRRTAANKLLQEITMADMSDVRNGMIIAFKDGFTRWWNFCM